MFESSVQQISEEALDSLFSGAPETTPTADSLSVGAQVTPPQEAEGVQFVENVDDLFADEEPKDEPEKKEIEKDPIKEEKVEEEVESPEEEEEQPANLEEVNTVLKNTVDYLVSSGQWADFEGREDLEVTQEVYAELAARQNQFAAIEIFNELIDSTGDYGKTIINHIKNGGKPEEVIDLFKEQKTFEQIDTTSDFGKKEKIEKYYTEVMKWKPDRVNKHINRLVEMDELDTELGDVEVALKDYEQERLQELNEKETERIKKKEEQQKKFVVGIRSSLENSKDYTPEEKRLIEKSLLEFKHNIPGGIKVNDFYLKFAEMQQNPQDYIDLVMFVMNKDYYNSKRDKKQETRAAANVFNFVKGNAAINKNTGGTTKIDEKSSNYKGTNFSFKIK